METKKEQSNVSQTTLYGKNGYSETVNVSCASCNWIPTMQLRWKKTVVIDDFIGTQKDELQQLWTGNLGEQEWRPIEFVE